MEGVIKVNIEDKLSQFSDHWNPRIVGSLNGQHVKLAKLLGDLPYYEKRDQSRMALT